MTIEDIRKAKRRLEKERPEFKPRDKRDMDRWQKDVDEYYKKRDELNALEREILQQQERLNHDIVGIIAKKKKQIAGRETRLEQLMKEFNYRGTTTERRQEILELDEKGKPTGKGLYLDVEEEIQVLEVEVVVLEDELIKGL